MADKQSEFYSTLSTLLNERLTMPEVQSLKDEGFKLKKPTRKTAVMIALYKKAVSGDLSSIKELNSILSGNATESESRTVTIIEDIPVSDFRNSG